MCIVLLVMKFRYLKCVLTFSNQKDTQKHVLRQVTIKVGGGEAAQTLEMVCVCVLKIENVSKPI